MDALALLTNVGADNIALESVFLTGVGVGAGGLWEGWLGASCASLSCGATRGVCVIARGAEGIFSASRVWARGSRRGDLGEATASVVGAFSSACLDRLMQGLSIEEGSQGRT